MPGLRISTQVHKGNDTYKPWYLTDGSGRDMYIVRNNGGFMNHYYTPSKQNTRGLGMYLGKNQMAEGGGIRQDPAPAVHGKIANYNYDGSGRDRYIADANGGFYP